MTTTLQARVATIIGTACMLLALSGCEDSGGGPLEPETVYLDLVAIARALGRDELMNQRMEAAREQLNAQLLQITADLNQELELERSRLGEDPAEEDQRKLESMTASANRQIQQTQIRAQQKYESFRQGLVSAFQQDVAAVARSLAEERGAKSVELLDETILWLDPRVDITDEVIAVMRAQGTVSTSEAAGVTPEDPAVQEEVEKLNELVDELSGEAGAAQ